MTDGIINLQWRRFATDEEQEAVLKSTSSPRSHRDPSDPYCYLPTNDLKQFLRGNLGDAFGLVHAFELGDTEISGLFRQYSNLRIFAAMLEGKSIWVVKEDEAKEAGFPVLAH